MRAMLSAIDKHNRDLAIIAFAQMDYHIMMNSVSIDSNSKVKKAETENIKKDAQELKAAFTDPDFSQKAIEKQKLKEDIHKDYNKYRGLTPGEFIATLKKNTG